MPVRSDASEAICASLAYGDSFLSGVGGWQLHLYCIPVCARYCAPNMPERVVMNSRVRQILDQINALEDELHTAIEGQENRLRYQIEGKRVVLGMNQFSSDQISLSVVSDSLRPHESKHARPPCP